MHRMTLVSFRFPRKVEKLREFFGKMVHTPSPAKKSIALTPMGTKLARTRLLFTRGTRGTVQVFERQTVLQPVTEFARFRVNGLHK